MEQTQAMLCTDANPARLAEFCEDDSILAQQKVDGDRCLMHVEDGKIMPITRNGLTVAGVKANVLSAFKPLAASGGRWVLDGEFLNNELYLFDLIHGGQRSFVDVPLVERLATLSHFYKHTWKPDPTSVKLLPTAAGHAEKVDLAKYVISSGCEGLVFKDKASSYTPGKSELWLRVKLRYDVDCEVMALGTNGKRNMVLGLYRDGVLTSVGECTATAGDGPRVKVGQVVKVKYQYASDLDKLVQPTKPKIRTDKAPRDCTWDQLIYANKTVWMPG